MIALVLGNFRGQTRASFPSVCCFADLQDQGADEELSRRASIRWEQSRRLRASRPMRCPKGRIRFPHTRRHVGMDTGKPDLFKIKVAVGIPLVFFAAEGDQPTRAKSLRFSSIDIACFA